MSLICNRLTGLATTLYSGHKGFSLPFPRIAMMARHLRQRVWVVFYLYLEKAANVDEEQGQQILGVSGWKSSAKLLLYLIIWLIR
jgi:hypothetical protein